MTRALCGVRWATSSPRYLKVAGVWRKCAGDNVDQRRLAGAVFAEQDVNFATAEVEVDAIQGDDSRKTF